METIAAKCQPSVHLAVGSGKRNGEHMNLSAIGVRVLVNDFQKCFDFYTQKLGFEVYWGDRNGPFTAFKADGIDKPCFSIFLARNQHMYQGYVPLTGTGRTDQVIYVIPTDNLEEDYQALKAKGVCFMGEPQTIRDWQMRCVYFRDPEGNLFELSQDGIE
jgi:catechol 2,3-dioxygenase-like lactoylglutathione lyase family enzyme